MNVIQVAIPVLRGKRKFYLAKGRRWSVVEHVFLAALVGRSWRVQELAAEANVPRRLTLEILIRLMRAGWVKLQHKSGGVEFAISAEGLSVVDAEELPYVSKPITRSINFVIDRLTGTLYRRREFPFLERHVLEERAKRERFVWMQPRKFEHFDEAGPMLDALFDEDETFRGMDPSGERLVERFGVVSVRNGVVEGLPPRAPAELGKLVLLAAKSAPASPVGGQSPKYEPAPEPERNIVQAVEDGVFGWDDVLTGGAQHKETFEVVLRKAAQRLVIHSTFVSEERFQEFRPLLYDAAKRGVVIDIMWGESEEKTTDSATRAVIARLRDEVRHAGLDAWIRLHPFSTGSHAKLLVADDPKSGRLFAILGSCNWFSSAFGSYEVSVRMRDARIVSSVLAQVTELSRGADGHWTELTNDLARLTARARGQNNPVGARARLALVYGPQHADFVRLARDKAKSRIFVLSHRLGAATRPAVVIPAIAAVKARGIKVHVFYGTISGSVGNTDAAQITTEADGGGVELRPVHEPRLHAKALAWDDNSMVVTSQNWLSADPSDNNPRREIGLYVNAPSAAKNLIEDFLAARKY